MNDDGNKRKLYNALSKDYDMGSYEQFSQDVEDEGKRRKLYDAIKGDYDLPDFNGFSRQLAGGRRQAPAPAQSPVPTTQRQQQPQRRQQRSKAGRQQRSKARKMSPAQIAYFNASVARMRNSVAQTMERSKNISAYVKQRMFGGGVPAFGLGVGKKDRPTVFSSNNVVAGDIEYNPKTGKIEQTYLTQAGNKHTSRFSADMEQRRIDEEKERRLHPVESQLKAAEAEKERLAGLMRKRMEEIDARKTGHPVAGLIRDLADESHGMPGGLVSDNGMRDYRLDPRYRQLEAAARKNHQTIKTLRDKRDGLMNDFWHTLGDTLTNGYTFSDGQSDANDALSVMEAQRHVDAINRKRQTGEQLTKDEESAEAVLSNFATDEMVQGMYGNDYGAWARAATTTGTSLDFMKDILLTGGGAGALTKGIYKGVVKGGMKLLARKGVETGLKAAIGKGLLKATGVALGTTAAGVMITNTTGINRTAGEAGRLMAGHVGVNENGGYNIEGQKGMLEAIAEAERDMIGENQSEMFGEFIPGVGKYVRKGLEKIGLSRVSNALTSIGNKEWYRRYSKLLKAGGWNGLPGEGIEEYEGLLFDALTGHGSEALEQVQDPRTHIDIWLGCATMGALLGSAPAVAQAGSTAQYYRYKHQANKSGASAASFIGDRWNEMQEQIDGTPNGGMADVLTQMVLDPNLNHEQKNAVLDYARNLTKMRGCNLAAANNAGEEKDPDAEAANNAYGEGYNATEDTDMQDVKNRMEVLSESVGEFLGEDVMRDLEASPVDTLRTIRGFASLSDGQKQMAVDYVNAKSAYDGLIQRVRDDIDSEIAQSDAMVDSRVAREEQGGDGMIHPATLKEQDADGHDKQVFVVSGNVRMMDDGSMIDTGNSDETIIVRDAETGKLQFMSPGGLLSLGDVIDAEQLKEETRQQIRERKAREAADKTDGTLAFAIGDTYQFPDEAGGQHTYAIMQDLGDGMVAVALDGNQQMPVSMSKQELQAMADARNRSRVTNLISRQGQQTQADVHNSRQPQYNLNEEITLQAGSEDVRAIVTSEENEDGLIEVESDQPINGRKVNMFSREQLDGMLSVPQIDEERAVLDGVSNVGDGLRDAMSGQSAAADEQAGAEPMPMIDVKGRMKPDWSKATPQRAHAYLYNERGLSRENADAFVENNRKSAESELAKLRKKRPKMGTDLDEFEEKTADWQGKMDDLQRQHDYWKAVRHEQFKTDSAEQARISEKHARRMEEAKRRRAEEERLREEAERKEREAINGVPDMVDDTPQDARARGYRRVNGYKVDRQEPLQALQGKAVSVKFSNDVIPQGNVAVIDARQLQPSHAGGQRNPLHFIDEAQPKERIDDASRYASSKIAGNIRPEEITSSVTAYTGAPTINARGEVIQGNNRSDALRQMWQSYPEEAARYKQYLIGHAADFGLRAEDIEAMQSPVLVNMLDVEDAEAITLGQFVAQDTESGGTERIKAKNAVQKMGNDMRTFANLLLKSADEEATFAQLLDDNGTDVLKWMSQKGYITPTQYKSAFDGRGNVSGEAKNDLRSIMYQSVFRDGGTRLEEMFNAMPVKAQKAILATAYRDYDSPIAERMVVEIQNSIRAFNAMSQDEAFKKATNFKDAREAAEMWKRSYQFDDATGESYLPSENFSNFALLLATLYKGANQTTIQGTFNKLYDLIQGTQETSLFEQPDNTPRTLAQAIRETLNIEYNGQRRSNVLAGDSPAIQGGQQGSNGNAETGERAAPGEEPADGGGGTGSNSEEVNTPQIAPSGQLKTAGLRDVTNPDNAGIGTNAAKTKAQDKGGGVDRQGNPLNSDGTLYIEEVASIDDITDADFEEPTRTIALPDIPNNVRDAIGAGEKPVIIKKNIFERNGISHSDLTPEQSRDILRSALYNADLYGQNQKNTKPYNWVVINITDEAGKNKLVLLEVNQNNNNVEIVHWHYLDARGLEKLRRQADREDGQLLILPSIKEEVGALSDPTDELSSAGKDNTLESDLQGKAGKSVENNGVEPFSSNMESASADVNTSPTEAQKEAGSERSEDAERGQLASSVREKERRDNILPNLGDRYTLSEEQANNGEVFYQNADGSTQLATIPDEIFDRIGISPIPFKLTETMGWHVYDHHAKEAKFKTIDDAIGFVLSIINNVDHVRLGRDNSYIFSVEDGRNRIGKRAVTIMINSGPGDFMGIRTSGYETLGKLKERPLLWERGAHAVPEDVATPTISTIEPQRGDEASSRAKGQSNVSSVGKVSENSATGQGKSEKTAENEPTDARKAAEPRESAQAYTIESAEYTNKKGKTTPMHLVRFSEDLTKEQVRAGKELVREPLPGSRSSRGWWDAKRGGFMVRSEEAARELSEALTNDEAVQDAQPMSVEDLSAVNGRAAVQEAGEARLSGHAGKVKDEPQTEANETANEEPKQEEKKSGSKWVDDADAERFEELRKRLHKKLNGQLNMGIDPEAFAIGVEMSYLMLKHGARKFGEFARQMIDALGENVRPYLKSFYNGARDLPEMADYEKDLTPYGEVRAFDVMNFDKEGAKDIIATAEHITREQEAGREAREATRKLKEERNANRTIAGKSFRPATEKDVEKGGVVYYGGKPAHIMMIIQRGEQTGAARFSKPRIDRVYLTNGKECEFEDLMVEDEAKTKESQSKEKKSRKKAVTSQGQTMADLFSGLLSEDTTRPTSDEQEVHLQPRPGTSEREGGHQRGQNEPLGASQQHEDERADASRVAGRSGGNTMSDTAGSPRVSEPSDGKQPLRPAKKEFAPIKESERRNTHNNHSERGTDYAPKSTSARIEANIKAIETMQRLTESGQPATPGDMAVLRKFSGWGGLGEAFREKAGRGDRDYNPRLRDDYQPANPINARLRGLLSPEAYEAANMSRNSAYYTPAPVIDAMWDVARAMGFRGGSVLEGSAGIGNIIGLMPADMSERSNIHAVEIDETTGNILSLLYPDANVEVKGFEKTHVPNGSVDLAITNVPFVTGLRVLDETGDKDLSRKFHDIHDFCIAKNVRKLKEGGVGIFITSSGTLDSPNSAKLRTWLVNEGGADVVGAFRMHNQTFGGTGATSDIIVIRKRVNGQKSANAIDIGGTLPIRTVRYNTGETKRGSSEVIIKDLALDVNKHFVEHPEDMAGEMAFAFEKGDTYRATSKALYPSPGINQEQRLSEWARQFKDMDWDKAGERETQQVVYEDLGEDVKEGSMLLDGDGNLCLAQRGKAVPINVNANKVKGHTKAECFNAYKAIKDALADVLEYQTTHSDDNGLQQRLAKLNKAYDAFVKTYGHLNKNTSISFLRSDMDYPSIAALESVSETGDKSGKRIVTYGKTDIFSRRVVETESEPKPATIKDGIIASIYLNGRVDVPYIAGQLGKNESEVREQIIKSGIGFENPTTTEMEVSYEYLSGNVREKLRQARENNTDGRYDANIKALERVIPMNIPAHLIEFTLGSSWVEPKLYEDFVKERTGLDVKLTNAGGTWIMNEPWYTDTEQNRAMGVYSEKCEKRILGHELIKAAITCKSISVSKTQTVGYGSSKTTETIVDKEATVACANKIDEIRQDFKDWARGKMQGDPEMSERMERVYNDLFNNSVPKEIPDEFVPEHFGGAATVVNGNPFQLRPHQAKAVVRATTQPLMLAHEVGTGKTYTLISTAMEMRRLGTARKPMIVVQNATVGQFVASAKALYPNANILTLEDADRNADGRRNFYAKIRYNDWDMIVVPQSVFERIPDSEERQIRFVEDKVEEKMTVLEKMREAASDDRDPVVRQAERELSRLDDELNGLKLALQERKSGGKAEKDEKREAKTRQNAMVKAQEMLDRETDDVANFDDMGIDALLIDEAHEYKHLGFETVIRRGVKGVDPKPSKKSQGVYLKTQAVLESKNGKNVVFATGTPISNTAAEIWTFMRYLMPADTMREYGIYYFDDFVRNFGNIQQMLEFSTNGKYKENNRFAGYVNLPELVRIWAGVADTVLTREAGGVSDKIPEMEGGKARDIYLPQTKALRGVMKFVKDQLDDYERMSGKEKKENSHIPLVMYGIAKAAAVDARLVLEDAADEPNSKTNEAVRQTLRSLEDSKDYNGTVAIFADNYQNKSTGFNLYEDIRKKLIDAGVPEAQVVVMKSGMSIKKKVEIFDKVNRGEVRVIMGSTFTLGTGVNIQERLHTLIHVDAPNRPMDYTQRNGRILRQGNLHNEWGIPVRVLRFGVEDSLDVTAYQRLKTKGAIADSIMEGKKMMSNSMENRVLEEEQDLFGDITAQLSGSQYALLKNQVEKEVRKLEARRKQWEADQTYVHNQKPRLKALIKGSEERAARNKEALEKVEAAKMDGITVGKVKYPSLDAMVDYIKEYNSKQREQQEQVRTASGYKAEAKSDLTVNVGGFDFHVHRVIAKEQKQEKGQLSLSFFSKTQMTYSCPELGMEDIPVDGQRLKNALEDIVSNVMTGKDFREKAEYAERAAERYKGELQQVEARDGKPFEYADELKQAKDKLAEYEELMKAEMAEKEAKYAEMDASVDAAKGVQLSDEDSEEADTSLYRDDEDDLEDGEREETYRVMQVIDGQPYPPMAAVREGSESTSSRQAGNPADVRSRAAFARRQWRRAHDLANDWIEKLGIGEITSVYERIGDVPGNERFSKRRLRSKGWYDPETGRIAIVMNNHHSPQDVLQTILHEAVAHYGLRKLFGKNFDNFLDNVYDGADILIKERIAAKQAVLVSKGKNAKRTAAEWRRVATEEYLAELAESTDFENAGRQPWAMHWFNRIKSWFLDMLHSIGLKNFGGQSLSDTISDNELRYILWRSYKNLTAPGAYRNYFNVAEDIAMQDNLGVGNYSNSEVQGDMAAEKELFRDDDFSVRDKAIVRDAYERMVTTGGYQFQEAVQDSMLGLKRLYQAVLGKSTRIEDVSGNENAYLAENRMSSVNAAEQHEYYVRYMRPLLDVIGDMVGSNKYARNVLTDYMMAKHGLERNEVMAQRDFDTYHQQHPSGAKTLADFRERDYAGLTALTGEGDVAMAEQMAQQMVDDYEQDNDTDALWDAVRNATGATLEKIYSSGLLSKERYEQIQQMFENYIPLQGWDETTSDEVYGYLTSKNGPLTGSPIKHAAGRSSKADDPIATIALMADTAIRQGNRNKMKQTFLNFALNHPSDLVSVNDLWVHYNAVMDEWEPVFADIEPADTAEDVERKVAAFEERMKQLAESDPGNYKRGRDTQDVPYKVVRGNMREHQILVRRNGRTYVLTINGNPRAAQALNGLTNPDVELNGIAGNILRGAEWLNRNLSAFYTTRNPDFVARNFFRDMLYSNCMTWVKESPRYALRFHWNFGRVNPARLRMLLSKWERGTLDDGDYIERLFKQFMLNGGETGYTNVKDIEGKKRDIAAELKRQASKGRLAWHAVNMQLDLLNRSAENCARFAAFITSREMGRSMERSIHDAKEVSVNFNKKGSGGKMVNATGQTALGKMGAYIGGGGRLLYVFWNAGVQGTTNFARAAKRHPVKFTAGAASMFLLGAIVPMLAQAMGGGDDDDKDAYYNLPEYVRRSNILLNAGDQWISIPLPIEFRALYGLGELATGVITGNERYSDGELAFHLVSQVSQMLPLDVLEGGGGVNPFIPSAVKPLVEAYFINKSWSGMPIYKDTPWNKDAPEWQKAYKNANTYLVSGAKWLNEISGGDDYKKGFLDINPAKLEYLLGGMFGGAFTTADKLVKMGETVIGSREFDWRNMLIANGLIKTGDERTANRKLINEYFKYKDGYDETKRLLKNYSDAASAGDERYQRRLERLQASEDYLLYDVFDNYQPILKALHEAKDGASETMLSDIDGEENALRREMVDLMHAVEDDKHPDIDRNIDAMLEREFNAGGRTQKSAGSRIARRLGGTDGYGSPGDAYGEVYLQMRSYVDLAEDVLLQVELKKSKEAGDIERSKSIDRARREITEVKKDLTEADTDEDRNSIMEELRALRREKMEELGISMRPNR